MEQTIDRGARNEAVDLIRRYVAGDLDDVSLDQAWPASGTDPAPAGLQRFFRHFVGNHPGDGCPADKDVLRFWDRAELFLRTDTEFTWPVPHGVGQAPRVAVEVRMTRSPLANQIFAFLLCTGLLGVAPAVLLNTAYGLVPGLVLGALAVVVMRSTHRYPERRRAAALWLEKEWGADLEAWPFRDLEQLARARQQGQAAPGGLDLAASHHAAFRSRRVHAADLLQSYLAGDLRGDDLVGRLRLAAVDVWLGVELVAYLKALPRGTISALDGSPDREQVRKTLERCEAFLRTDQPFEVARFNEGYLFRAVAAVVLILILRWLLVPMVGPWPSWGVAGPLMLVVIALTVRQDPSGKPWKMRLAIGTGRHRYWPFAKRHDCQVALADVGLAHD